MTSNLLPDDYPGLLREIKERIQNAQYEALKAVNKERSPSIGTSGA